MKRSLGLLALTVVLATATHAAHAACYADYKAKKDGPLELHYGVATVSESACGNAAQAAEELRPRVKSGGWELLNVVSTFGEDGLDRRRESAGDYFLRF